MDTYLITATPPTPNGDLHVGHLSGPFLAADVFRRFQRMHGHGSVFVTGSDDHQSYVLTAAAKTEEDPAAVADAFTERIQGTLEAAEIEVDCYTRALANPQHRQLARALFRELAERGLVVRKRHPALFCGSCERLLFEGFVRGWCSRCGEETPGHLCEMCGWVNDPVDLVEPTCSTCRTAPKVVEREGLFLPLEPHRRRLESFWSTRTSWRPHLQGFCEAMLAQPLPDYLVGHPGNWGVPVPIDGFDRQVINVWLEMYAGHVHAGRSAGVLSESPPANVTLVQFLGHDNSFYNAVLHVTVALALGGSWPVPEHVIANEFYFLGGSKFSTSRNHTVSGREALALAGPDCLRLHLARTNPERWQTSFSRNDLLECAEREMDGIWTAAVEELCCLASQDPPARRSPAGDLRVIGVLEGARSDLERYYGLEEFSPRRASTTLVDLALAGRDFARRAAQAKQGPAPNADAAADAAAFLRALALLAAPLMPGLSQGIWKTLGAAGKVADASWPSASDRFGPGVCG